MKKEYFISFVQEAIFAEEYQGYIAGRIEVGKGDCPYAISECRIFTNKIEEFNEFLEEYDFKWVNTNTLKEIKEKSKYFNIFSNNSGK